MNGGKCVEKGNSYTCNCAPGYTGNNCDLGRRQSVVLSLFASRNMVTRTRNAHLSSTATDKCNLSKMMWT